MKRVGVWLASDGAGELTETKLQRQLLARSCKHQVAARGAHHENGPSERAVQEIDTMIRASIVSSGIPMREWCFVAEHMSLVDAMTSYSTSDKSKTIFEAVYGFVPDVDSLPPIGCFACRLEETKEKSDRKLGLRNTPGTFVGFATLKNCFGGVILTGKNTHIVGNLQMAYDPLFMPFKDKPSTNPRYEALYNILGRVNDKLQTNDDCDSGKQGLERAESSDAESSNADTSLVPNIDQEEVVVDADDDSSDDDIVDETVKEMHEILVKVPPFNPLRADKAGKKSSLRPVPSIVRRVNSTDANADEQLLNELRKGNGEDKEVLDGSDLEASSSSEALAQAGHRRAR